MERDVYFRDHQNGVSAITIQWAKDDFSGGTYHRANGSGGLSRISGDLSSAQHLLDEKSGCPQPCQCPAWWHAGAM